VNRLILKYAYPTTVAILLVFAWVIIQRLSRGWTAIIPLAVAAVIVWIVGTMVFLLFWPRIIVSGFKRAIVRRGLGGGPVPVNTLYAVPRTSSATASSVSLLETGTDDVLYVGGWLDVTGGPQVLHTPDMAGRYYSLQFTDPSTGDNFAYVGTRATGTGAGDFLLAASRWTGPVPQGMTQISVPSGSAIIIGRVFVADDGDLPAASALAQQLRLDALRR
jgi:hypothetical protein